MRRPGRRFLGLDLPRHTSAEVWRRVRQTLDNPRRKDTATVTTSKSISEMTTIEELEAHWAKLDRQAYEDQQALVAGTLGKDAAALRLFNRDKMRFELRCRLEVLRGQNGRKEARP